MSFPGGGVPGGATAACTSCLANGDPADILCEDCENADAEWCTPVATDFDGTNSVSVVNVAAGLACTDKGNKALQFVADGGQGESFGNSYTASSDTYYFHGYLYVSELTIDTSTRLAIMEIWDTGVGYTLSFDIYHDGVSPKFSIFVITYGPETDLVIGGAVSTSTWYEVEIYWTKDTTNGAWFRIDGGTTYTMDDDEKTENVTPEYINIGSTVASSNFAAGDTVTLQWDIIEVDNNTMPGSCP